MKKTMLFVISLTLCGASLFAEEAKVAPPNPGGTRFVGVGEAVPDTLVKIFSNLGPSTAAYDATGYYVAGPLSVLGSSQSVGLPFKPAKASHAEQIRAGISWNSAGANQVNLSLYSDASGVPGTLLAGPVTVTSLPTFGTCCKLAIANIPSTALTAGTQYWIVADTPTSGTGSDFEGVWDAAPKIIIGADVNAGGWFSFPANVPAGAVYGTIP
jgi:hypothetical protein